MIAACDFCYIREQGTHGEIKREWSPEWLQFIPVCRKHALADGMDGHKTETEPAGPRLDLAGDAIGGAV